jgi:hypothetical protein
MPTVDPRVSCRVFKAVIRAKAGIHGSASSRPPNGVTRPNDQRWMFGSAEVKREPGFAGMTAKAKRRAVSTRRRANYRNGSTTAAHASAASCSSGSNARISVFGKKRPANSEISPSQRLSVTIAPRAKRSYSPNLAKK